ncbi:MAG: CHASE2 domain-containing protein, partial [candidate division Zixibacteria bacterium]|nr:CHASE2 domain-containing protein [candidate division Zixibacteria bacterium]
MFGKYASYILCLLISIFIVALYLGDFSPMVSLEWKIQDILYSFRGKSNYSSDIILVNIDRLTLRHFGRWPWRRDKIADLLAAVGSGQPKTILLDVRLEPNANEDTSGYTAILAGQMSWMKNVILPYEVSRAEVRTNRISNPKYLYNSSVTVNNDLGILDEKAALPAQKVFLPSEELCKYAAGLGFNYDIYDKDRCIRWEPLVMTYEGYYYPSSELSAAASFMGISISAITIHGGDYIKLGTKKIPTNDAGELLINYNKPGHSFLQVSAADILNENTNFSNFRDKLVIISVTEELIAESYKTPVSPNLPAAEKTADVIENIIHSNYIRRIDSSPGTDMLILFALGGVFAFFLPRVSFVYRMIILIICMFVLANLNFILFNSFRILIPSLYLILELLCLVVASPILDNEFLARFSFTPNESFSKRKMLRLPKIELAEEKTARDDRDELSEIGEENIETRVIKPPQQRQIHAEAPKEQRLAIVEPRPDAATYDATAKAEKLTLASIINQEPPVVLPSSRAIEKPVENIARMPDPEYVSPEETSVPPRTPTFGIDGQQIKNLGRYKVIDELGKGAMGTVYKGVDPAINRNVALKTIR